MTDDPFDFTIDLDAERKNRAAQREGKQIPMPIKIGGQVIATLPVEMPVDVLAPPRELDGDITLILREVMHSMGSEQAQAQWDTTKMVIDLLAANPALPVTFLDTLRKIGANLLTEEGLAALLAQRPSAQDYGALAKGVFSFYGVTLGEASPSSDSPTGESGGTSSGTSSTTSDSTPEDSGTTPEPTPSLESAAS